MQHQRNSTDARPPAVTGKRWPTGSSWRGKDVGWANLFLPKPAVCSEPAATESRASLAALPPLPRGRANVVSSGACLQVSNDSSSDAPWQAHGNVTHPVTPHGGQSWPGK